MKKISKLFLGLAIGALSLGLASCSKDEADSVPPTDVSVPSVPNTTPNSNPDHTEGGSGSESIVSPTPTPSVPINPDNRPKFDDVRFDNDGAPLINDINVEMYDYKKDINLSDEKAMYLGFQDFLKSIIDGQVFLSGYQEFDDYDEYHEYSHLLKCYVPTVGIMTSRIDTVSLQNPYFTGIKMETNVFTDTEAWVLTRYTDESKASLLNNAKLPKTAKPFNYLPIKAEYEEVAGVEAKKINRFLNPNDLISSMYNIFKYGEMGLLGYLSYENDEFTLSIYDVLDEKLRGYIKTDAYSYLDIYLYNNNTRSIILNEAYLINNNDNLQLVLESLKGLNDKKVAIDRNKEREFEKSCDAKMEEFLSSLDSASKEYAIEKVSFNKNYFITAFSKNKFVLDLSGSISLEGKYHSHNVYVDIMKRPSLDTVTKKQEGSKSIYTYTYEEENLSIDMNITLENNNYEGKLDINLKVDDTFEKLDYTVSVFERGKVDEKFNPILTEPVRIETRINSAWIGINENCSLVGKNLSSTGIQYKTFLGYFFTVKEGK